MSPAAELAVDALILLRRGHVRSGLGLLARLPRLISDEVDAAYEQGRLALAREIAHGRRAPAAKPPRAKNHAWLAAVVRDPQLRQRALDVLRIRDADLNHVLAGKAELSSTMWKRLLKELGG